MRAWRYLEPQYADAAWALGCMRIGTLSSYAALEDALQDPFDGGVKRTLDFLSVAGDEDRAGRELAKSMGIDLTGFRNAVFQNVHHVMLPPPIYCICLSDTDQNEHLRKQGRTTALEIPDVEAFADAVARSSPRFTGWYSYGPVAYEPRNFDARAVPDDPDPFKKAPQFEPEREIRIIWQPAHKEPMPFNLMASRLVGLIAAPADLQSTALRSAA